MAEEPEPIASASTETWGGRFLDYVGLGLILTATDILVRESAISLASVLYGIGGATLFAGFRWKQLREKFAGPVVHHLETMATNPRYWLAVFAFLLICARITMIPPIIQRVGSDAPASLPCFL